MQVEGVTWHGVTLEPDQFTAMKKLCGEVFGLTPMIEDDGWTLFPMPNGTVLDLFDPDSDMVSQLRLCVSSRDSEMHCVRPAAARTPGGTALDEKRARLIGLE